MTTEEYKTLIDEKLAEGAELDDIPKLVVGDTDEVNQENGNGEIYQYLLDKNLITPEDIPSNEQEIGEEYSFYDQISSTLSIEGMKATGSETKEIFSENPEFLVLVPVILFTFFFMWSAARKFFKAIQETSREEKEKKDDGDSMYETL